MMTGEFSRISHAASIPIASAKATHKGRAGISQRDRPKKMKPWMTWLKLYQSDSCWLFWFDCTVQCHKLTVPHGQIGGRPIANSPAAKTASSVAATSQPVRDIPAMPRSPRSTDVDTPYAACTVSQLLHNTPIAQDRPPERPRP